MNMNLQQDVPLMNLKDFEKNYQYLQLITENTNSQVYLIESKKSKE